MASTTSLNLRPYAGAAGLPEDNAASAVNAGARPSPSRLNLGQQTLSQAQPQQQPLIDASQHPLGALGLILSNTAAGLSGGPSPVAALQKQKLDEQQMQFKSAELAQNVIERYAPILANEDPANWDNVLGHMQQMFGPAIGGMDVRPLVKTLAGATAEQRKQFIATLRISAKDNPQLMNAYAAMGSANVPLDKIAEFAAQQAAKETPEQAAAKATAVTTAQEAAKGETFSDQPFKTIEPKSGKAALAVRGNRGSTQFLRDESGNLLAPTPDTEKQPIKNYDDPKLVEIDDGKGGTKQVTAQQNFSTGQWVTADEKRTPIDSTDIRVIKDTAIGSRVAGQVARVLGAATLANKEVRNMLQTTSGATTGIFSEASLAGTAKGALARAVTSDQDKSLRVTAVGIQRALAGIEAMGLVPPGTLTNTFNGLIPQAGESRLIAMQKFGSIRQVIESGLETLEQSPVVTKKQIDEIKGLRADIQKAIPWEPTDVIKLMNAPNPKATVLDFAKSVGLDKSGAAASAGGTTKSGVGFKIIGP